MLIQEDKGEQNLVYYASQVLNGAELNYLSLSLEKLAFVVLMSAIKLRPYFKSHTIEVRTNYPLQKVLHKPELSRRLSIWAMMLSAYDIRYTLRNMVKA